MGKLIYHANPKENQKARTRCGLITHLTGSYFKRTVQFVYLASEYDQSNGVVTCKKCIKLTANDKKLEAQNANN